jgi:copper chaperone
VAEFSFRVFSFRIEGMHCAACVRRVTQALQKIPGSQVESVSVGSARVRSKDDSLTAEALIDAVGKAGYRAFREDAPFERNDLSEDSVRTNDA